MATVRLIELKGVTAMCGVAIVPATVNAVTRTVLPQINARDRDNRSSATPITISTTPAPITHGRASA